MDKKCSIYAMAYYSAMKKGEYADICDNMDEPGGHPSKKEKL